MSYAAGVDVGSTQTKAVVVDEDGKIVAQGAPPTRVPTWYRPPRRPSSEALRLRRASTNEDVGFVVGTGYGRYKVDLREHPDHGDRPATARGAVADVPGHRAPSLDMGGQDTKAIRMSGLGRRS